MTYEYKHGCACSKCKSRSRENAKQLTRTAKEQYKKSVNTIGYDMCFVATFAYGDINAPEVIKFREFRDNVLNNYLLGRLFVFIYYRISPTVVVILEFIPGSKYVSRKILNFFLGVFFRKI